MGREATCNARLGRETGEGKALLETDEVLFRGDFRARVPLHDISGVEAKRGVLTLTWPGGTLALTLGAAAEKWAEAIRHPKSVVEKLGVKPGLKVAVLGGFDPGFHRDVARSLGAKPLARATKRCDLVFVRLARPGDEARLAGIVPAIAPAGGVWAVYPKGRRELSEDTVRAAAKRAGLVDVKVVRFSDSASALKLVIPKVLRAGKA
jgi:hypothetical protein